MRAVPGIPGTRRLFVTGQYQQQSNWCWDATTVSITLFYEPHRNLTQCQLANQALGKSTCCQAPGGWSLQQLTGSGGNTGGPPAVGDPAVVQYKDQMHVCYRDGNGLIQDAWYDGQGHWSLQHLTGSGGNTGGPPAVGDPAVVQYKDQMHACYRDRNGLIQDAWYDGQGHWSLQHLTGSGGNTGGPPAAGDPAVVQYKDQMHACYRDRNGLIQDAWYDGQGHWSLQHLTGSGGNTGGPPAAGDPAVVQYKDQMHACYRDRNGLIQDAWYDGQGHWSLQQLTGSGGNTGGPPAAGDPAVVQYKDQMHACYRDRNGLIQDAWYDGQGHWSLQQLTGGGNFAGGNTDGPPAVGDPAVVQYEDQMHVCYRDGNGLIQDAWYDGQGHWSLQQLTGSGGDMGGPPAVGDPAVVQYKDQMHVCYRDGHFRDAGLIQDAWYDGSTCNVTGILTRRSQSRAIMPGKQPPSAFQAEFSLGQVS